MTYEKAKNFAARAHAGQFRKFTEEPYIVHPIAVADLLINEWNYPRDSNTVQAALLHDVVEDTEITLSDIHDLFGSYVHELVKAMTSPKIGDTRMDRAYNEAHRMSTVPFSALSIRCADIIHNISDLHLAKPDFARQYLLEKSLIVAAMPLSLHSRHLVNQAILKCLTKLK